MRFLFFKTNLVFKLSLFKKDFLDVFFCLSKNKHLFWLILLLCLFFLFTFISLGLGTIDLFSNALSTEQFHFVFFELRIPRTLALISIGASLSLCGVLLQTLLANPLSEPFTLGLSGASTLGAVIFLFFGFSPQWLSLPLGSFIGSLGAIGLILLTQGKVSSKSNSLILVGVMISFFAGALVTLVVSVMTPYQMQQAIYWMMGQVGSPRDHWSYFLMILFLCVFIFFYFRKKTLDTLLLGKDMAQNLGVSIEKEKLFIILLCSFLTAVSVSISGLVGFVGLVAPHITYQILKSRRHSKTLIMAPLVGATLFLLSDILSRAISQETEIPAGSLMALIGAPLLVYFLIPSSKIKRDL